MATWVKYTNISGKPVFVNLSTAMSAYRNEDGKQTLIAYPGSDEDVLRVRETPDAILQAAGIDYDSA